MNFSVRRQVDGNLNALKGDVVLTWISISLSPEWYRGTITGINNREVQITLDNGVLVSVDYSQVRHAIGGAGYHRLREQRLMEALPEIAMAAREDTEWDAIDSVTSEINDYTFDPVS
jgi:hypothetical protein